jgi:PAS domain S-box-containing protein
VNVESQVPDESLEELYELAPCGYLSTLSDGTIVRVNQTFLTWTGYDRPTVLGKRFQDLLTVPCKLFYQTHFAPLLRLQGFVKEIALDLVCENSSNLSALINSTQHCDTKGNTSFIRIMVFDATDRRKYERELLLAKNRAEQLVTLIQASSDAILQTSIDGKIQIWNAGAERLFGYSSEEAKGQGVQGLIIPPDRLDEYQQAISDLREGQTIYMDTLRVNKNGRRIDVSLSLTRHNETFYGMAVISSIIRDISDRKLAESRIHDQENELRLIMDATPALISYLDHDFRYLRVNKSYENWFCIHQEHILGHTAREIIGEKAWSIVQPYLKRARSGERVSFDYQIPYGTGKPRWVHGNYIPYKDANGLVKGIVVHVVDIEERKVAENALRASQMESEFLANLIRTSSQPVATGYPDGRLGMVNPAFEVLTGYSVEELEKIDWVKDLTPPEWRKIERDKLAELQHTGQPIRYEKEYIRKDGTRVPIELLVQLVNDAKGKIKYYYAFVTDITSRKQAETAIRKSEDRLALGIQVAGLALAEIDYAADLNHLSAGAAKLFGLGEAEIVVPRETVHATFHPDDHVELMRRITASLDPKGEGWFAMDHRVLWPDGSVRWLRVRKQVFFSDDGNTACQPIRATLAIHDITTEKLAVEAVLASESYIRAILNSLPEHVVVLDVNGLVTAVNEPWERFAIENNASPHCVTEGANYLEVCRTSSAAGDPFAREALKGLESLQSGQRQEFVMEYPCPSPTLNRWFLMYAKRADQGITGIVLSHIDITERKRSEDKLHSAQARLTLAIDELKAGYWEWDLLNRTLYLSPEWKRQLGFDNSELDTNWNQKDDRLHPDDRATVMEATENFIAGRQPTFELQFRLRHKDGTYRWIHSRGALLRDQNNTPYRMLGLNLDVTDYLDTRELNERRDAMERSFRLYVASQTAAAIAHELNQPLTAISYYAYVADNILKTGNQDPQKLALVMEKCGQQAQRAGEVIKQLLALLHKGETISEPVDLNNSVQYALAFVKASGHLSHVKIGLHLGDGLPLVMANSLQVQKVLVNLLNNGLESMQESGNNSGTMLVTTCRCPNDPTRAQLTVCDSGTGVTDINTLKQMFQSFYTTKATGLGMGLAISRALVEAHGGKIWAEQNADRGISVHFTLPFVL